MNILYMPIGEVAFKRMIVTKIFSIFHYRRDALITRSAEKVGENVIVINKIFTITVLFHFFGKLILRKNLSDSLHRKALEREYDQKDIREYLLHCVQDSNLLDPNRRWKS